MSRRRLIQELDESVAALTREWTEEFEAGAFLARKEAAALADLAEAIARNLGDWRDLLGDVDLARAFDPRRAARLILEVVFDEILAPTAWRVLAAAVAVSEAAP